MRRIVWRTLVAASVGVAAYVVFIAFRIEQQSAIDESRLADVIVVLGAAEYNGRPSPVYRARLNHGLDLYRRKLAPRILTTGGAGGDPLFTEGEVGRAYLVNHNVPSEAIIVEPVGESTAYSLAAVAEIMRRMDMTSCIVVSDGYHIYRVKKMLEFRGLTVYGSPRPGEPGGGLRQWMLYLRQAGAYALWRVGINI